VLHKLVRATNILETRKANLGNNSTELSGCGRDTVRGRTVASWEGLTGHNESRCVRAEVLEEVGKAIEEHKHLLGRGVGVAGDELFVTKAHAAEDDSEQDEAHELDRLAAPGVDEEEGCPVAWNETTSGEDKVTHTNILNIIT
jgi:hypothetical protein